MRRHKLSLVLFLCVLFSMVSFLAQAQKVEDLLGAGASFPYPLYTKWFDVYSKTKDVKVNYQSIGSGGGIRQLQNKTVDFGASDAYLSREDMKKKFEGEKILHIPTALGAVAVIYNLPELDNLKLTPELVSDIFLGKIRKWNDEKIRKVNPDVELPKNYISVVRRADGSGTTFIFTDYLSKVSPDWEKEVGRGKSVKWPVGIGGKGNEGVAGQVKQLPGSIGYAELIYAEKNDISYAAIKNKSGNFVKPSLESVSQAGDVKLPDDLRVSITDTDADNGYPIAGFTWLLVYQDMEKSGRSLEKARAVQDLLEWAISDAQKYNKTLLYAPLPEAARKKAGKLIESMTYGQESLSKLRKEEK